MKRASLKRGVRPCSSMAALVLAVLLLPSPALAEGDDFATTMSGSTVLSPNNGSGGTSGGTTLNPADFSNSISLNAAQGSMTSVSNVQDNSATNAQNGREHKAGDAQNQSNAGKTAAIIAGTGMVAAAIPLLASIIPAEVAAGADLMAKAGLEFAQAAASGSAGKDNKGQKDLLKAQAGQGGDQQKGQQASASPTSEAQQALQNNPQLQNFLSSRGVNSDDFINRLSSGEIRDTQAVLGAVGNTTEISPEAQAQGANIAAMQFNAEPEPRGNTEQLRIANDDSAKPRDQVDGPKPGEGGGGSVTGAAGAGSPNGSGPVASQTSAAFAGGAALSPAQAAAAAGGGKGMGIASGIGSGGGLGTDEMMATLMRSLGIGASAATPAQRAMVAAELARKGIIRLNPKQNVFQLAHRNYRSFQKWRRQTRVAQNVR